MLRLSLALGGRHVLKLLLTHRFFHRFRRALELALRRIAALGGQGGAGGLLLRGGFGRHEQSPLAAPLTENQWPGRAVPAASEAQQPLRSEEHTSELQSLMRISYAVFCLK